jgi:Ion channel.
MEAMRLSSIHPEAHRPLTSFVEDYLVMVGMAFGLFAVVSVEVWLWTLCYLILSVTPDFESALYLSTITYSTVGCGDVIPAKAWRLLSALEGVIGFLMIGWSTAYLVTAGTRFGPFWSGERFQA